MKKRMVRFFCLFLILASFAGYGAGCGDSATAEDNLIQTENTFFTLVREQQFDQIYSLLASETQNTLTYESFIQRYQNVMKILGESTTISIQAEEFEVATSLYQSIYFTMTYHSPVYGDIEGRYTLPLIRENEEWRILWTPSLLFPSMDWSDSLHVVSKKPERGEIFASGELVAANRAGQSVYATLQQIPNWPQFAATLSPYIDLTSEEILEKLSRSKLMGRVTAKTLNIRQAPSLQSDILLTLNQGETFELRNQGLITHEADAASLSSLVQSASASDAFSDASSTSESPSSSNAGFYRISYQNGTQEVLGYAYAPYVDSFYSQDIVVLTSFPPNTLNPAAQTTINSISGASVDTDGMTMYRYYPYGESLFHLVGYVSEITKSQYDKFQQTEYAAQYPKGITIGQIGIESEYELALRGKEGLELYISNYDGSNRRTLYKRPAENGKDIHLSIDPAFQSYAYQLLRLYLLEGQSGAIVVSDPQTGAVRVATSYPSTDPNAFYSMSKQDWQALNLDNRRPFFNRAINASYAPGSIFKPFTAAVALNQQKIGSDTIFPYQHQIEEDRWTPPRKDWIYPPVKRIENKGRQDYVLNYRNAMAHSDNIYFAWVALEVGQDAFLSYCYDRLGFDETIPFDLHSSKANIFNERKRKEGEVPSDSDVFNIGFLASSGYGQGEMTMSPLYANMLFSGLANHADIMRPYIVESLRHAEGEKYYIDEQVKPTIWKARIVDREYDLTVINQSLHDVMSYGTGRRVQSSLQLAGKTGTAQRSLDDEIAWFSAFKADSPRDFAVTVAIESKANQSESRYAIISALSDYRASHHLAAPPDNADGFTPASPSSATESES